MAFFGENGIHAWAQAYQNPSADYRDAYNISSVADVGTGQIGFNFSVAAINNDYAFVGLSGNVTGNTTSGRFVQNDATVTTSYFELRTRSSTTLVDETLVNVIVVSDN